MPDSRTDRPRACPECETVFVASNDLDRCPTCRWVFRASAPRGRVTIEGATVNVVGRDPEWSVVAPTVANLRLADRPLPTLPMPRLLDLTLYGRTFDDACAVPPGLRSLGLHETSVLDLDGLPPIRRLDLAGSRYCVTRGFGPRRAVAPGFTTTCRDLLALGLNATEVIDEALGGALAACPGLTWLDLGRNRRLTRIDLTRLDALAALALGDLRATSVALPRSLRSLIAFRARELEPLDLSRCDRLVELDLSFTPYADAVLETLPANVPLIRAQLEATGVARGGLAALARVAPGLEELNLGQARIDDADLELLRAFPRLRQLSLQGAPITNAGLRHLDGLPLERLDTRHTGVSEPRGDGGRVIAYVTIADAFRGEGA